MSLVTKTGDHGTTALMYGRRVPKNHPCVEAVGAVDELNAALGLARATAGPESIRDRLREIQPMLVTLMGELAVEQADLPRYLKEGHAQVTPALTARLEAWIQAIEAQTGGGQDWQDWVMPGATPTAAALDFARTVCRRAERRVCDLSIASPLPNHEILIFLNRLSDLLWLLARQAETMTKSE